MISMGRLSFFFVLTVSVCFFSNYVSSDSITYYGDYNSLSVSVVTCSDHPPGLWTGPVGANWNYASNTLISQVSQIHNNGGLYATAWNNVTGDGSSACLNCLQVSYGGLSVQVTTIDRKGASGVDLSDAAFDCLFGAGAHIGGGNYDGTVTLISTGPCANGGGCVSTSGGGTTTTTTTPAGGNCPTTAGSTCSQYAVASGDTGDGIATKCSLDFTTQLSAWNTNVNWSALSIGEKLCVTQPSSSATTTAATTTTTTTTTTAPTTTAASGGGSCTLYSIVSGDTCYNIANTHNIALATFEGWNPSMNCSNLQVGEQVCITAPSAATTTPATTTTTTAAPTTTTTTTAAPTTTTTTTKAPTTTTTTTTTVAPTTTAASGGSCTLYSIVSGDTCYNIANTHNVALATFEGWNPSMNCSNLQIGEQVCVTAPSSSGATTAAPTTTTTTTTAPTTTAATTTTTTTIAPTTTPASGGGTCGNFNINSGANFIGYWGQNSGGYESNLAAYCKAGDTTFQAFHIAFMNDFGDPDVANSLGMNLAGHCTTSCNSATQPGLLCCPSVATDIQTCQSMGKKVLMSLGGAVQYGTYSLTATSGPKLADFLWNMFLGGTAPAGYTRPFGNVVLDGIDLDIENANSAGYAAFITQLRSHYSGQQYLISGAPQCPYPDASLGPSSGTALAVGGSATLDYIVVQFYNNGVCNTGGSSFVSAFNNWASTSVTRVMVGFLGMSASGSGYVDSGTLKQQLALVSSNPKFGGAMSWDTGTVSSNLEGGSTSYASTVSSYLQSNFCSGGSGGQTTTVAPTTTAASGGSCTLYSIVSGDTCYNIANTHNIALATFEGWNPSMNCSALQVGQQVCISAPSGQTTTAAPTTVAPTTTAATTTTAAPTTTTAAPTTTAPTTTSSVQAWSPNGVSYTTGTCVTYQGNYYTCRQPHTSMAGWDPVDVPSLWLQVTSCSASAATTESGFSKQKSWAVPLIVVVCFLMLALFAVLCYKKKVRDRSYTSELGLPDLSPVSPTAKADPALESAVLTTQAPVKESVPVYDQVPTTSPEETSGPGSRLPAGWSKMTDPSNGQQYYYNSQTGVSQWDAPDV